jgi:hypothetical protein
MAASTESPAERLAPRGLRVPDFFIVGHKKSGTTALHAMLSQHPEIFMPSLKEPHFFATDRVARFKNPRGAQLPGTLDEYLGLFEPARADQRAGEASASYLWSRTAAAGIAELRPDARIVAILREPASFLRSQYLQFRRIHFEDRRDMRAAIEADDDRRAGRKIPKRCPYPAMLIYSDHVRYTEQLRRYHDRLPRDQVLVLIYEEFRADNVGTVRRVLRFLGVDEDYPIEPLLANPTDRTMRSQSLDETLRSVSLGANAPARAARSLLRVAPRGLRRGAMRAARERLVYSEPPPPDESLMLELRRRFKPEVEAASEYLGRDLVGLWGYDRLD